MEATGKSSNDILDELFSTFNTSFSSSSTSKNASPPGSSGKKKSKKEKRRKGGGDDSDSSSVEKRIRKARKEEKEMNKKKKKKKETKEEDEKRKGKRKALEGFGGLRSSSPSTASTSNSSPEKKRRKRKLTGEDGVEDSVGEKKRKKKSKRSGLNEEVEGNGALKQVIGDGFVILNKSNYATSENTVDKKKKKRHKKELLEDGEILDEDDEQNKSRTKKRDRLHHHNPIDVYLGSVESSAPDLLSTSAGKKSKLSASQAYKLDAEERLLLGYGEEDRKQQPHHERESRYGGSTSSFSSEYSKSSSSSSHRFRERRRSRSRSPSSSSSSSRPRLAPPRDSYRSSYLKFEKERDHNYYSGGQSQSKSSNYYDSASYYDYHAQRGRSDYISSRGGFGYVGKSYYYDDVEEEDKGSGRRGERSSGRDRNSRDRYGRDRDSSRDSGRSSSSSSSWRHRHRSRSPQGRSYYHPDDIIDKAELLEIARKNAKKLMQRGVMPTDIFSRDQILALKAGGKSVEELTHYCKRLAKRDAAGDARDDSSDDDDGGSRSPGEHFIHHPFQVKDKPLPTITMNIRNAVPLPVRSAQELAIESAKLRTQFPVSSGTQHRFKELEWKPVAEGDKKEGESNNDSASKAVVLLDGSTSSSNPPAGSNVATVAPMVKEAPEKDDADAEEEKEGVENSGNGKNGGSESMLMKAIEPAPSSKQTMAEDTGITVDGPDLPLVDISSVIGLRLKAMRLLQENPTSRDAQKQLDEATQMMKHWADAKALEPKFLTPAELASGPQAWAKRDQLRKTRALDSGMGMHLLQKMGWKPGEGLGKNKEGQLEPLALDVKTDKKGLTAAVEELMYGKASRGGGSGGGAGPSMPSVYDLSGKHPVSALMELTAKRRWGAPEFELCFEHGPPHKRQFVYKVIVNGVEYQPCVAVGNKKQAKANAAAFCLQSLGLLPAGMEVDQGSNVEEQSGSSGAPSAPAPIPHHELLQTVRPTGGVLVQEPLCQQQQRQLLQQQKQQIFSALWKETPETVHNKKDEELMPPPPPPVLPPPVPPPFLNSK